MAAVDAYHDPAIEAKMYTDLTQYSHRRRKDGPYADNLEVDVLIVGAGFGKIVSDVSSMLLTCYRRCILFEDSSRSRLQGRYL